MTQGPRMPALPSGTVAFFFTDIEGSTARWEANRPAMAAAVERHLAVLEAAITANGGTRFKTIGDSIQAVFPTAPQAIAAALDAQCALLAEDWGAVGPLHVRMALHAGEAIPDERGDYLAAPLNRLARLLAAGHGDQILLSQAIQQLSRDALPERAALLDLGEHRLRDLLEPERVFQLRHPELPERFPPLRSLEARPTNLPPQPTPFLGREKEIGRIVALLQRDDVPLLTLTGPGGTGKTRLAVQSGLELLEDFADGVWFVPLAPLADPALVVPAVTEALGVRDEGGAPLADRLRDFLAPRTLLLVLDNAEHLVTPVAALTADLLAGAPGLTVLVTSRVPLRLRAEREYAVPPLSLPRRKPPPPPEQLSQFEAVRLFIDRAQAVRADFAVDNANAPAVAEICHRLDGLPLAIELAAARVRMLSPQAMLARLEQRLPLLTGGARDAPQRQRTLRDAIAWSHDLLDPVEQTLFRRLAVFAGGAGFEAIEAVTNPDGTLDVFGGLERLVEHSLVRQDFGQDRDPRFAMLETIREFALEQLMATGEDAEVPQRHAEFFLDLAETAETRLRSPEQGRWLDRLEADHDNLRAALAWGLNHDGEMALRLGASLYLFWFYRGHFSDGKAWLDRVLQTADVATPARVTALHGAGMLAEGLGDYASARDLQQASLDLARALADRRGEARALLSLGVLASSAGDDPRAGALMAESLSVSRALGDPLRIASTLNGLGYRAFRGGDLEHATEFLPEALSLARGIGDAGLLGAILDSLGAVSEARGDRAAAAAYFREALALAAAADNQRDVAFALSAVAGIAVARGFAEPAVWLFGAAARLYEAIGAPPPPEEGARHAPALAEARAGLGEIAFQNAWETGQSMSVEDATAEALNLADEVVRGTFSE
jgi:predicted ATPase/class 3 adenylate cyclase